MKHVINALQLKRVPASITTTNKATGEETTTQEAQAELPTYGSEFANGFDLRTPAAFTINRDLTVKVNIGWAVALPDGYGMLIMPRSGQGNAGLQITNTIGLIDQDYRGPIIANLTVRHDANKFQHSFEQGERFAQAIIVPIARVEEFVEVDELPPSARGEGGFGSSGNR